MLPTLESTPTFQQHHHNCSSCSYKLQVAITPAGLASVNRFFSVAVTVVSKYYQELNQLICHFSAASARLPMQQCNFSSSCSCKLQSLCRMCKQAPADFPVALTVTSTSKLSRESDHWCIQLPIHLRPCKNTHSAAFRTQNTCWTGNCKLKIHSF